MLDLTLQDSRVALAYAPQKDSGRCAWAAAHALYSNVLEALTENTQAGLCHRQSACRRSACACPSCGLAITLTMDLPRRKLSCTAVACRRRWPCSGRRSCSPRRTRQPTWSASCAAFLKHTQRPSKYIPPPPRAAARPLRPPRPSLEAPAPPMSFTNIPCSQAALEAGCYIWIQAFQRLQLLLEFLKVKALGADGRRGGAGGGAGGGGGGGNA